MRILLVNDYVETIAGTEIYMWSLKVGLEKRGHIVQIYGKYKNNNGYQKSINNKSLFSYVNKVFNFYTFYEFRNVIKRFKPDIIHIQNIFNELSPSFLLGTQLVPVIMTVHNNQIVNPVALLSGRTGKDCEKRTCSGCRNCIGWKGAIYEYLKRKIYKVLLKKICLYITPSKFMGDFIQEAGFHPVKVINNGIRLLEYSKIKNYNKLLYIGRLTKVKGIEYLLRAMPEVISKFPKTELQLIGDGNDSNYFINLTQKLGINNNVKFVKSVKRSEINKYYSESTIVIVPSIYADNFPTVCIEAMSVGLPVIGTTMGGIPELIEDGKTGYLIPPFSPEKLVKKITQLLSDKSLLIKMSKNARQKSLRYSIQKHINKIEIIYENTYNTFLQQK